MSVVRWAVLMAVACSLLAGCAKPPQRMPAPAKPDPIATSSIQQYSTPVISTGLDQPRPAPLHAQLAGRVIHVASKADIRLRDGEVVLTFDDGPSPKLTGRVLAALDAAGVKATFLSVGRMARAHPEILQQVALAGHSIGTHTDDHSNLSDISYASAMSHIAAGERAVAHALAPVGVEPAPFFRFPYLAATRLLRTGLADELHVVLDVDIDSQDYLDSTPQQVLNRTLRKVEAKGRGIILFHDIQWRTAKMLPDFLDALAERGYKVVHLVPAGKGLFDRPLVTAEVAR